MYNDVQDPYDPYADDPNKPSQPLASQTTPPPTGTTAPAPTAPAPAATPIPTNPDGSQVGSGTTWDPKTGAPTAAPAGYHWDANMASFEPDAATKPVDAPTGSFPDDASILAQIGKWASMPGADPSLGGNPSYWLSAIKSRGGLNAGNLQYWQDAGVGPSAFFNNPNREGTSSGLSTSGGQIAPPNLNPGGNPANQQQSDDLFNFLMQKAHASAQVDPNDPMIRSQADNYSANLTRQGRQYLSELAERKGAGGNIGAESRMVAEKNGQASATHEGDLLQHESDLRRQEIEQALTTGAQFLTAQQQMSLQKELAQIDANMKLYSTQVQNDQFGRSLAQNQGQFATTQADRESQFSRDLSQRAYQYDTDDSFRRSPYAQPGA